MAVIKVDVEKLINFVKNELNTEELKASAEALKKGWDWNPFDKDGDEYVTAWQETNMSLRGRNLSIILTYFGIS